MLDRLKPPTKLRKALFFCLQISFLLAALFISFQYLQIFSSKRSFSNSNTHQDIQSVFIETNSLLSPLSLEEKKATFFACQQAQYWEHILAKTKSHPLREILSLDAHPQRDLHYPRGDIRDTESTYQYFFHQHRGKEKGHFHLFASQNEELIHLLALSVNAKGKASRLFITQAEVTGDKKLLPVDELIEFIEHFRIEHSEPSWPLNQWLKEITKAFKPQIKHILHLSRNKKTEEEVLCSIEINLEEQTKLLKKLLNETKTKDDS